VFLKRHLFSSSVISIVQQDLILICTWNLFLKHNVTNVWLGVVNDQRLSGAAKWGDLVYEIDNQSVLYYLLHNATDRERMP
jgi:hypothetical protein